MAVNYDPDNSRFVSDMDSIGRWATSEAERREALQICLNDFWSSRSIGCIERVENSARWGWKMFAYRAGNTGPPKVR